ncbi:alpha/beta hydrolase [Pseudoxanthomonas suwonensis]|uniref:alpha/beta hydrolase n=1 Tax=Pseudoxanthomonas suwonensis TaxID=314722 RepID=UPI00138F19BA|nr:alpha/beta hydrolase [Pseudoxanthomonas suwonensis]KAF1703054.1 alpha/beta hydrolase [Pseudoxanthomonas suwonensis]
MKTRKILLPLATATACLALVACGGGEPATQAGPQADDRYGELRFQACTLAGASARSVQARCATYEVPEDPENPDGRRIALDIAWLPATEAGAGLADPVFFLAGGPGQSAVQVWPQLDPAFAEVRRQRHVVLVDQRGTGGSNQLQCDRSPLDGLDPAQPQALEAVAALARECAAALADRADPRFYTTTEAVADLEAVRQAIGAEEINLVGGSYGTRVAQQYAKRHPEHVRSIVLDGVAPNDLVVGGEFARTFEDALSLQAARCRGLPECAARFPQDPRAQLRALVERLGRAPVEVEYRDPASGESLKGTVDAGTVTGLAFMFSYMPQTAALLPLVLDEAAHGRYAPLKSLSELMVRGTSEQMSVGMQWSVVCAEDADRHDESAAAAEDTLLGPQMARMFFAMCAGWPRGSRPDDFTAPLESDVPALLLSGEMDPVTPPRYAERVLQGLPNGRHLVLQGQGHGTLALGCMPRLLGQFMETADAKSLDAGCLSRMTYVPPFTSFNGWEP